MFGILDIWNPDDQTHISSNAADSFVEEIFREDMENKTQSEYKTRVAYSYLILIHLVLFRLLEVFNKIIILANLPT